jgi:hypothetical protein
MCIGCSAKSDNSKIRVDKSTEQTIANGTKTDAKQHGMNT